MTTPEEAKAVVRRWNEEGWSGGKYDVAYEIIAPVMTVHGAGGQTVGYGPDGLIELIKAWRSAFPDGYMSVDELLVEGDLVGIRNTWHGTHTGTFYGIPPSGKWVEVTSVSLDRVADGQVVEGWGELDMVGMMQQMEVLPLIGPGAVAAGRSPTWGDPSGHVGPAATTPGENKEILVRFVEGLAAAGDLSGIVDARLVDHSPNLGTVDFDSVIALSSALRAAFPDLGVTVDPDSLVAEDDRVESHALFTGTHSGAALFGVEPTGATVTWTQHDLVRIVDGRIVERWACADTMSLLQQLGLIPAPG
jgi:predicted ester cyclase